MKYLHTMIRVANLDKALEFFCNQLEFVEIKRTEHEKGRFTLIYLAAPKDQQEAQKNDAPLLELTYNWDPETYTEGRNFGHLAYEVENIYDTCERLQTLGVTINRPPRDGYMAFIRSPDNISIELLQKGAPRPLQEPWISAPNIGHW